MSHPWREQSYTRMIAKKNRGHKKMSKLTLTEHLAINVIGWIKSEPGYEGYRKKVPAGIEYVTDYDPLNNIAQAMGLLDTFDHWDIQTALYTGNGKVVRGYIDKQDGGRDVVVETDTNLCKAICLSVAKATGYTDD